MERKQFTLSGIVKIIKSPLTTLVVNDGDTRTITFGNIERELMEELLSGSKPAADARLIADVQGAKPASFTELLETARLLGQLQAAIWLASNAHSDAAVALSEASKRGEVNG